MTVEEKKEDQTQEKVEVQKKETEQPQKEEKSEERVLPKEKPFSGSKMLKHLAQIEAEEELSKPKEEVKEEVEKPAPEKKAEKQAKETKPFKTLKRKGEEVSVQTEKEYDKLASQGLDYTKKRQEDSDDRRSWEKGRDEKENKLLETGDALKKLVEGIERGNFKIVPTGKEEPESDDLDDLDPEIRDEFKKLREENKNLKEGLNVLTEKSKVTDVVREKEAFNQATVELDTLHETIREEIPYDHMIKDGERNISEQLFTGLSIVKNYQDRIRLSQDKDFKQRDFKEIFTDTAKDLQAVDNYYKAKYSSIENGDSVTVELLSEKYPELIKEIGQSAVELHLSGEETAPASIRSTNKEAKETDKSKGKITGLKDAFSKAFENPEISESIKEFSKEKYGLKND